MAERTKTRGNVIVEDIKIGDIHYEYEYNFCIKTEVVTQPELKEGMWTWKSKNVNSGSIIDYSIADANSRVGKYNDQFAVKLYDHEAYIGAKYV